MRIDVNNIIRDFKEDPDKFADMAKTASKLIGAAVLVVKALHTGYKEGLRSHVDIKVDVK